VGDAQKRCREEVLRTTSLHLDSHRSKADVNPSLSVCQHQHDTPGLNTVNYNYRDLWKTKYKMQMLIELLQRKNDIDEKNLTAMNYASYDRWLIDAMEALLKIELQRQRLTEIQKTELEPRERQRLIEAQIERREQERLTEAQKKSDI
jgi:hypothetical protein